jgi:hypothetical protein
MDFLLEPSGPIPTLCAHTVSAYFTASLTFWPSEAYHLAQLDVASFISPQKQQWVMDMGAEKPRPPFRHGTNFEESFMLWSSPKDQVSIQPKTALMYDSFIQRSWLVPVCFLRSSVKKKDL